VQLDLSNRPMSEIRALLSRYPVKTRLSLTGTMVVARDIAHARRSRSASTAARACPRYLRDHMVYYAGPAKTPEGTRRASFGPTTAGRMDATWTSSWRTAAAS
jgi:fumarate hydratase class I